MHCFMSHLVKACVEGDLLDSLEISLNWLEANNGQDQLFKDAEFKSNNEAMVRLVVKFTVDSYTKK